MGILVGMDFEVSLGFKSCGCLVILVLVRGGCGKGWR